jgi:hypothetical protein
MMDDIKKTLWATADKLRANMDAAEYKHLVLGLIFVKTGTKGTYGFTECLRLRTFPDNKKAPRR